MEAPSPVDLRIDEIQAGDVVGFEMHLRDADIDAFASLTGDRNPIHVSDDAAQRAGFVRRIAHGLLIASCMSTIAGVLLPGRRALLMSEQMDFLDAVPGGSRLAVSARVSQVSTAMRTVVVSVRVSRGGVLAARGVLRVRLRDEETAA